MSYDMDQNVFYLFGGIQAEGTQMSDVWKFDIQSRIWTFLGGSRLSDQWNTVGMPGSRAASSMIYWPTIKSLAIFGGEGLDSSGIFGQTNDLWFFDLNTSTFAFISGSRREGAKGSSSIPGARAAASLSLDEANDCAYLFGGYSRGSKEKVESSYAEIWKLDLQARSWSNMMSGTASKNAIGSYNQFPGINEANRYPGSRYGHTAVFFNGSLILFGGRGYASLATEFSLNDLWVYDMTLQSWTWMAGSRTFEVSSNPAAAYPASRFQHGVALTTNGRMVVFFGFGIQGADSKTLGDMYVWEKPCPPDMYGPIEYTCQKCPVATKKSTWGNGDTDICLSLVSAGGSIQSTRPTVLQTNAFSTPLTSVQLATVLLRSSSSATSIQFPTRSTVSQQSRQGSIIFGRTPLGLTSTTTPLALVTPGANVSSTPTVSSCTLRNSSSTPTSNVQRTGIVFGASLSSRTTLVSPSPSQFKPSLQKSSVSTISEHSDSFKVQTSTANVALIRAEITRAIEQTSSTFTTASASTSASASAFASALASTSASASTSALVSVSASLAIAASKITTIDAQITSEAQSVYSGAKTSNGEFRTRSGASIPTPSSLQAPTVSYNDGVTIALSTAYKTLNVQEKFTTLKSSLESGTPVVSTEMIGKTSTLAAKDNPTASLRASISLPMSVGGGFQLSVSRTIFVDTSTAWSEVPSPHSLHSSTAFLASTKITRFDLTTSAFLLNPTTQPQASSTQVPRTDSISNTTRVILGVSSSFGFNAGLTTSSEVMDKSSRHPTTNSDDKNVPSTSTWTEDSHGLSASTKPEERTVPITSTSTKDPITSTSTKDKIRFITIDQSSPGMSTSSKELSLQSTITTTEVQISQYLSMASIDKTSSSARTRSEDRTTSARNAESNFLVSVLVSTISTLVTPTFTSSATSKAVIVEVPTVRPNPVNEASITPLSTSAAIIYGTSSAGILVVVAGVIVALRRVRKRRRLKTNRTFIVGGRVDVEEGVNATRVNGDIRLGTGLRSQVTKLSFKPLSRRVDIMTSNSSSLYNSNTNNYNDNDDDENGNRDSKDPEDEYDKALPARSETLSSDLYDQQFTSIPNIGPSRRLPPIASMTSVREVTKARF